MTTILQHMVEMTAHRDHLLLDTSVITALHDLVGATEVRAMEIFRVRDELFIRPLVSIKGGVVTSIAEIDSPDLGGEPLASYPNLVACIEQHKSSSKEEAPDGNYVMWLPVWINDKVTTCIEVSNSKPYADSAMHTIEGILTVYSNYQSLLDYSERDSLTGLLNRKTFDDKFSKMVASTAQEETSPENNQERRQSASSREQWLAVVDIDHFKRVNDEFGHLYGDEVLILIANLLRASFRSHDRVFRFGGEEFVILLRSTTLEKTYKIFERFRENVESYAFPQVGQVTISLGFASITQETPVVILGHADQALYYAKSNGRNRVCYYDALVKSGELHAPVPVESDVEFF
ncbi:GGDEF domain-containing protein [soil metagenome]